MKLLTILISSLFLISCGGGNSGSEESTESLVKVQAINLLNSTETYTLSTSSESIDMSSDNITIKQGADDDTPIVVSNQVGEPMLLGRKFKGDSVSEVSIESTAEMFLLRNAIFFGITIANDKELSNRIRSHSKFNDLVEELKGQINTSVCPLDHNCSAIASSIANEIAKEINIADITEEK
jgi:hypothetical protein